MKQQSILAMVRQQLLVTRKNITHFSNASEKISVDSVQVMHNFPAHIFQLTF